MKILMVNKFLYPNGGSETYIFKLGEYLSTQGHEVQYFGMEHEGRIVGNAVNSYTSDMNFHGGSKLSKLTYPIKTIYNREARKKIRLVLEDFEPDVVHLNNFNYQLTPSIILEIISWRKKEGKNCRIVYTAHDGQFVCPNHMLYNPNTKEVCQKCLGGHFLNCSKNKCIHGSTAKSIIGSSEAIYWKLRRTYKYIDAIICPSEFMKRMLDSYYLLSNKTVVLHNFIEEKVVNEPIKEDYVLYFGSFTEGKGILTLIDACKNLPYINFIFAGSGNLENQINDISNIKNVGFKKGEELEKLISKARFSICPSELNENCPFSVLESQKLGTPVIGSNIGGIPELIKDGENGKLFEPRNAKQLTDMIEYLWKDSDELEKYRQECIKIKRDGISDYYEKISNIYRGITTI